MTPLIHTFSDAPAAAGACALYILQCLENAVTVNGQASFAVSGGSTPKWMFAEMAKTPFDWKRVHLFWVDERAVPPDDEQSNYRLADEYFIQPTKIRNIHRIPGELTPEQAAKRYTTDIREHFQVAEGDLPHFDVIHLGIGADAHTASLFPGEPLIQDRHQIAAAVYVEKLPQWRITLLPGVLLAARNMAILATGADKKQALSNILSGPDNPVEYPAQIVVRQARRPVIFLDQAAAIVLPS